MLFERVHLKGIRMKYYRTYVVCFRTSTGLKYYAGKRVSKYENPSDDPYRGSGKVITATVKKYGLACIESIEWADHTKETLNDAEIALIAECKEKYGSACVNIAKGGAGGGCTWDHYTEEQRLKRCAGIKEVHSRPEVKEKLSCSLKITFADPKVKARKSAAAKEVNARPEVKQRKSAATKSAWSDPDTKSKRITSLIDAQNRPEVKAKISESMNRPEAKANRIASLKEVKRTSPVWHGELYQTLWSMWLELGMPKYGKFQGHCKRNGVTDLALKCLVCHFNERYQNEQLQEAA